MELRADMLEERYFEEVTEFHDSQVKFSSEQSRERATIGRLESRVRGSDDLISKIELAFEEQQAELVSAEQHAFGKDQQVLSLVGELQTSQAAMAEYGEEAMYVRAFSECAVRQAEQALEAVAGDRDSQVAESRAFREEAIAEVQRIEVRAN